MPTEEVDKSKSILTEEVFDAMLSKQVEECDVEGTKKRSRRWKI